MEPRAILLPYVLLRLRLRTPRAWGPIFGSCAEAPARASESAGAARTPGGGVGDLVGGAGALGVGHVLDSLRRETRASKDAKVAFELEVEKALKKKSQN